MSDDLSNLEFVRAASLQHAISLESQLPPPLSMRTDDVGEPDSRTAEQAAAATARYAEVAAETVARALRHAEMFERYIRAGGAGDDLDALLSDAARDRPPR